MKRTFVAKRHSSKHEKVRKNISKTICTSKSSGQNKKRTNRCPKDKRQVNNKFDLLLLPYVLFVSFDACPPVCPSIRPSVRLSVPVGLFFIQVLNFILVLVWFYAHQLRLYHEWSEDIFERVNYTANKNLVKHILAGM